jgi:hypothetical protein
MFELTGLSLIGLTLLCLLLALVTKGHIQKLWWFNVGASVIIVMFWFLPSEKLLKRQMILQIDKQEVILKKDIGK